MGATGAGATVPALAAEADKAVPAADVVRAEPPENLDPQLLNEGGVRILNPGAFSPVFVWVEGLTLT